MEQQSREFIAAWKDVVERRDMAALAAMFAGDAVFISPAVFKPYQGRQVIVHILSHVIAVLDDLVYVDEFANDRGGVILHFRSSAPGPAKRLDVEGVDIFQLGDDGLIRELKVMIRPLRGLQAVAAAMEARLAASSRPD